MKLISDCDSHFESFWLVGFSQRFLSNVSFVHMTASIYTRV